MSMIIVYLLKVLLDVLIKVRDLVHEGVELVSHPLGASIRMLFSPYRSIVVGGRKGGNKRFICRNY